MKNKLFKFILLCSGILVHIHSIAQEVFFNDPNQNLLTIMPDYYYPLIGDNSATDEYMNPQGSRGLMAGTVTPVVDRWGKSSRAIQVNREGLRTPFVLNNEIRNNKVLNVCFWIKFDGTVYSGSREGAVFAAGTHVNQHKVSITLKNKKLYVHKLISGAQTLIGTTDFSIDLLGQSPGAETNGYIFVAISSTWNADGNRLRLYVGRPGGHLYCKYFYFSPFDIFNSPNDMMIIGGSYNPDNITPPIGMSDLMFFTNFMKDHMMHPDYILNLFYLQSPMYEGVSYQITSDNGVWGLETRRNNNAALAENYLTNEPLTAGTSIAPFGFDRFCIEKVSDVNPRAFLLRSMANGGSITHSNNLSYAYTSFNNTYHPVSYYRETDPKTNYRNDVRQFGLASTSWHDYWLSNFSGEKWLTFVQDADPTRLRITAANRVFKGAERLLDKEVQLRAYMPGASAPTRNLGHKGDQVTWDYVRVGVSMPYYSFEQNEHGRKPYIWNTFLTLPGWNGSLSRYNGHTDNTDGNYIITSRAMDCNFELQFVKNDVNGKPLYMIRTANHNVSFKLMEEASWIKQAFNNSLNSDGTVPDRCLWSICKLSGGWPLTLAEKAKLNADDLKSQQGINNVYYNGLSETDWPGGTPKP